MCVKEGQRMRKGGEGDEVGLQEGDRERGVEGEDMKTQKCGKSEEGKKVGEWEKLREMDEESK